MDATRQMLDELMGKERNVPLDQRKGSSIRFSDQQVCKYDLCGLCPFQLFPNTKSDLGPCAYEIHEDHVEFKSLKEQWDMCSQRDKDRYGYEYKLYRLLEDLVQDMDRKIEKQKDRAEKESQPKPLRPEDQQVMVNMQNQVNDALVKSQQMGEQGDVDASMFWVQQSEIFKQAMDTKHQQLTQPERQMMVCEVCGVFINSTDNDQRRKDHLNGKQYQGWKRIRDLYTQLRETFDPELRQQKEMEEERLKRETRQKEEKENGESNGKHRRKSSHKERERSRERSKSHRSRSRKHRSRSRSRGERSHSRRDRDYTRNDDYYDRGRPYDDYYYNRGGY